MEVMGGKGKDNGEEFWSFAEYTFPELGQLPLTIIPKTCFSVLVLCELALVTSY